jgi:hypothetical protein
MYGNFENFKKAYRIERIVYEASEFDSEGKRYLFKKSNNYNSYNCAYDLKYLIEKLPVFSWPNRHIIICDSDCQIDLIKGALQKVTGSNNINSIVKRFATSYEGDSSTDSDICNTMKFMIDNAIDICVVKEKSGNSAF